MCPKVSIIVPVYNVEKYLDRCMNSIINQTYRNLDIVLVDDGSTDRSGRMCEDWAKKDSRVRVIHKTNAGLGMARNTGIEYAAGEYICFFDSDDYVEPNTIEAAYTLAAQTDSQIVLFGMQDVDRNERVFRQTMPDAEKQCYRGSEVQTVFLPDLIDSRHAGVTVKNLGLSACSCMFSMELVRKTLWRFVSERQVISEDSYSLIWLYQYVDAVAILPDPFYSHCENESSLTRVYREDRYPRIASFYQECLALTEKAGYNLQVRKSVSGLFLSLSIAAMKQIAAAKTDRRKKRKLLMQIIDDNAMQQALADISDRTYGTARKVLFCAMRYKMYSLCHLLLAVQNTVGK